VRARILGEDPRARVPGEDPGQVMQRLPQIRRGGRRPEFGPQTVHDLVAVKAVTGRERQQLQQRRRLPLAPRIVCDCATPPYDDAEVAKQLDPEIGHTRPLSWRP